MGSRPLLPLGGGGSLGPHYTGTRGATEGETWHVLHAPLRLRAIWGYQPCRCQPMHLYLWAFKPLSLKGKTGWRLRKKHQKRDLCKVDSKVWLCELAIGLQIIDAVNMAMIYKSLMPMTLWVTGKKCQLGITWTRMDCEGCNLIKSNNANMQITLDNTTRNVI